ncbi:MAG: hypothetical protein FJY65_00370 [Calditrichaeota bacterium]|nr:hypothetical protein [Calditrichota bacterium]
MSNQEKPRDTSIFWISTPKTAAKSRESQEKTTSNEEQFAVNLYRFFLSALNKQRNKPDDFLAAPMQ